MKQHRLGKLRSLSEQVSPTLVRGLQPLRYATADLKIRTAFKYSIQLNIYPEECFFFFFMTKVAMLW